ncbi:hypothetical protein D9613_012269 [Agrocybe pediades]|uniref:Uncharacterized protein n=1 Tax=Agrocybe pediades TaxID=84607 RepID=A0A8H4VHB7_9AGAR|nr:hypothetical protein D9613_012269 [Agrocybe pediades]
MNDMHSYNIEQSRGGVAGHNFITVIMREYGLTLQEALYWVSGYTTKIMENYVSDQRRLPSWGETVDKAVEKYFDRVARCVRGCDQWSYESGRYYGKKGLKIQQTRKMAVYPKDITYLGNKFVQVNEA